MNFETSFQWNRRQWSRIVAAVVGSGLMARYPANAASDEETCTLGFSTYGMKSLKTEEALQAIRDIGFDSAEITVRSGWDADSATLSMNRRKAIRQQCDSISLRITSLMEHVFPSDPKSVERLRLAGELAHDLSPDRPPLVQTVLGGGSFDAIKTDLVSQLASWVEVANQTDTTIAIKPHRGGAVSKPDEAAWLIGQLGHPPRLRMVYDYSHYAFRDMPMERTIQTALPLTAHVAVKDAAMEGDRVVFKLPGQAGTIDFTKLLKLFYQGGYRGDFNCEVSGMVWSRPGYDPIAAAQTCYDNMNRAFLAAGIRRP